jgi:cell wall-associated NlpC family hydrolase
MERAIAQKQIEIAELDGQLKRRESTIAALNSDIQNLRSTQESLLDFLAKVTDETQVSILDRDVDWTFVKADLQKLPGGKRKQAILAAILLAWKEIPFAMGKKSVGKGFDSPRFIEYVLATNGLKINQRTGERLSDALMRTFERVETPQPGDLVFYRGQVGSFGFIYLSEGGPSRSGVGIGTLQAIAPLQIISLSNVNTPHFPLIGFFRVVYPDEK